MATTFVSRFPTTIRCSPIMPISAAVSTALCTAARDFSPPACTRSTQRSGPPSSGSAPPHSASRHSSPTTAANDLLRDDSESTDKSVCATHIPVFFSLILICATKFSDRCGTDTLSVLWQVALGRQSSQRHLDRVDHFRPLHFQRERQHAVRRKLHVRVFLNQHQQLVRIDLRLRRQFDHRARAFSDN